MSQVQVGGVDLCDNLPSPEALTAQTRNLNETNALTQPQSLSNNEKVMEEDQEKEGYMRRSRGEEEEDIDEVMKEEEEDMSEGSSSLIRCQSPDTPMTDSSYSETGRKHTHTKEKLIIDRHQHTLSHTGAVSSVCF